VSGLEIRRLETEIANMNESRSQCPRAVFIIGFAFCWFMIQLLLAPAARGAPAGTLSDEARFGRVHFPISATPAAQAQFDRAVAMLHSFWYEELAKEFGKVIELDPNCAMGYWGLAMSLWHPLWEPPDTNALGEGLAAV